MPLCVCARARACVFLGEGDGERESLCLMMCWDLEGFRFLSTRTAHRYIKAVIVSISLAMCILHLGLTDTAQMRGYFVQLYIHVARGLLHAACASCHAQIPRWRV